jgi:hypothetical protein
VEEIFGRRIERVVEGTFGKDGPPGLSAQSPVVGRSPRPEERSPAIAANKVKGIRAATCHDVESARSSRLHNDANVLSLGAGFVNRGLARRMVRIWLETPFEGGRHVPRIEKIARIEKDGLDARLR